MVNSGPSGAGMILWYPRTTCGPQLFYTTKAPTEGLDFTASNFNAGPWVKAHQYFNQVALVAGALSL
jgi:hypothetical protein